MKSIRKLDISLKQKLQKKELTLGSWITLGSTDIAELMARSGFDWLTIDMEHSAITLREAQQLVQTIALAGCTPLIRVSENNPTIIKQAMDTGACGVIVPMVNSVEEAKRAVASAKYPPEGFRGVGLGRAQGYGFEFDSYKKWVKEESIVIIQIEDIRAVNNLKKILETPGIDGFMVGPYDLSGSLGVPGEFKNPKMESALHQIKEVAKTTNVPQGYHVVQPNPRECIQKINEGYTFIAYSLDTLLLGNACMTDLTTIKNGKR